jgi:hypothetical protein
MKELIVRAWKDPEYRKELTAQQRSEKKLDQARRTTVGGVLILSS